LLALAWGRNPISRSEIARQLNMSMPTVMRLADMLYDENLVLWSGDSQSNGGCPGNLLEFNADGYAVLGLDLDGNIESEIYRPWSRPAS
jgi:hypothetical protein